MGLGVVRSLVGPGMLVVGRDGDSGGVNVWKRERLDSKLMVLLKMGFLKLHDVSGLQVQGVLRKYQSGK